jgi:hypothetical protein
MPRVGDYSKCKIYKLTSMNNPDLVYYGHTTQSLSRRLSHHKSHCNVTSSTQFIDKGDAIILLIEEYPCENSYEAKAREAFYILNNPCVNKNIPNRPQKEQKKEWYEKFKNEISQKRKEDRIENKDEINAKRKDWYNDNREKLIEHRKQYTLNNREDINEQKRLWTEAHKDEINARQRELAKLKREKND